MNAIGRANENARTSPHIRFRKLCPILSKKAGSLIDVRKTSSTDEKVGKCDCGTKLSLVIISHATKPRLRGTSQR
jgi:hypothetical protein